MQNMNNKVRISTGLVLISLLISGCDSGGSSDGGAEVLNAIDVSQASIVSEATKVTGGTPSDTNSEFAFPETNELNGAISMTIPNNPAPNFATRRTIADGNGAVIGFGDPVVLKYDMFSWEGGELVESSSQFVEAQTVEAGISDSYPMPEYLATSLLGRKLGDTVQIILPAGTEDMPDYLDATDAHVLMVEIL